MMHSKGHSISLAQWHHLRSGLHSWTLLSQHELAAREIPPRVGEQKGYLNRTDMLPIKILVQAVVIAGTILQQ